ncbi:SDR family NAD(P)-dependent oxidoreductase [Streptomyces sp. B21-106]|uniref:SDR family NAD(P)-dependent oxidoreductase n=1 Tax=unclassified Streptomyces TaxID=2593676 RepID=UPI002FF19199
MAMILVTGASSGLGRHTADALADEGHDVVVHVRDPARLSDGNVARWKGVVAGDLAVLDEIRAVARQARAFGRFDVVVHNAGVLHSPDVSTVNTVAPYVLTALMDRPARLVYLSSSLHRTGSTDLARLSAGTASYDDSKLWVTTLALAFASRWAGTSSHAVDPGWVPTRMGGAGAPDDLTAGHRTQTWLATHPDVTPRTGGYWHHRRTQTPHPASRDEGFQARLLQTLESHTGISPDGPASWT